VVNYETLVQQGESEWERILSALELGMVPDMGLVSRPSQQTWGIKAADAKLTRQYAAWMEHIDGATAVRIQKILDATSMNMYNVAEALPSKHT
jgi:hypothetical protein